jgi:hypothetical protein
VGALTGGQRRVGAPVWLPGGVSWSLVGPPLTLVWIVGLTNAWLYGWH